MRVVLRVPKRQVRVAMAASAIAVLGAGVAAQTDTELLGGADTSREVLTAPALPHDRTLELERHPEERLRIAIRAPVASPPVAVPAPVEAPEVVAPKSPQTVLAQQEVRAPGAPDQTAQEQQEQAVQPPAGADPRQPLLSPAEREALALVEQIIREQEGVLMGSSFDYVVGGRRDPFASLLVQLGAVTAPSVRPPGLPGFLISEVDLKGIASSNGRWHAMVIGSNQRAYFLEVGTRLFDGHVVDIRPGEVIFEQVVTDALGARRTREVTKRLRTTDGGGETP